RRPSRCEPPWPPGHPRKYHAPRSAVCCGAMATCLLGHGAYQGGWIWTPVVERLRAAGHVVHAPTLDGCAERQHQVRPGITIATHAQEIAQLLFYEDLRDVILAGTSAGGMVIAK